MEEVQAACTSTVNTKMVESNGEGNESLLSLQIAARRGETHVDSKGITKTLSSGQVESMQVSREGPIVNNDANLSASTPPGANGNEEWIFSRTFTSDSASQQADLKAFAEALSQIPPQEKASYLTASQARPRLLHDESSPMHFLKFAKGDARKAAVRFVSYWNYRHDIFGERAFLPLNDTGSGALSASDIVSVEQGCTRILPCDDRGRPVLYRSGILRERNTTEKSRCFFYFLALLLRNPLASSEGSPMIIVANSDDLAGQWRQDHQALARALEVVPVRIDPHIIQDGIKKYESEIVQKFVPLISNLYKTSATIHPSSKTITAMESLISSGFKPELLPPSIHGTWQDNSIDCYDAPGYKPNHPVLTEDEGTTRKRRLKNAKASRIKRARARKRESHLHSERYELQEENDRLRVEKLKLEDLLQQAENVVAVIDGAASHNESLPGYDLRIRQTTAYLDLTTALQSRTYLPRTGRGYDLENPYLSWPYY